MPHHDETDLPVLEAEGKRVRVVVGHAWGLRSPVETFSDTIYADITLEPGAALPLDTAHEERAVYVVSGMVSIGDDRSPFWPAFGAAARCGHYPQCRE